MDETLENWKAAGLITGAAFADEMQKLATAALIDGIVQEKGLDKDAAVSIGGIAKSLLKSPAARSVAVAGLAAGGGAILGKKREMAKAQKELTQIAPAIYRAGFVQGARQGFIQGVRRGAMTAESERGA